MTAPDNHRPTREQVEANLNAIFGPPMDDRTGFWVGALLILLLAVGFTVGFVVVFESDAMLKELFLVLLGVACVGCWYVFGTYLLQIYRDRKLQKLRAADAQAQAQAPIEQSPVVVSAGVHLDMPLLSVPSKPA